MAVLIDGVGYSVACGPHTLTGAHVGVLCDAAWPVSWGYCHRKSHGGAGQQDGGYVYGKGGFAGAASDILAGEHIRFVRLLLCLSRVALHLAGDPVLAGAEGVHFLLAFCGWRWRTVREEGLMVDIGFDLDNIEDCVGYIQNRV